MYITTCGLRFIFTFDCGLELEIGLVKFQEVSTPCMAHTGHQQNTKATTALCRGAREL